MKGGMSVMSECDEAETCTTHPVAVSYEQGNTRPLNSPSLLIGGPELTKQVLLKEK